MNCKMRWVFVVIFAALPTSFTFANCDLSHFHWDCDLPFNARATPHKSALVYCGNNYGYVTHAEYDQMLRYQRADVNMILTSNGEYVDSPCIPYKR